MQTRENPEKVKAMRKVVREIVDYLIKLPIGTETCTSEVIKILYGYEHLTGEYEIHGQMFEFYDFLVIHSKVHALAKRRGYILDDSKHDEEKTGLHFHTPFIIRKR